MPTAYYVTVKRAKTTGWLAGPYPSQEDAEGAVAQVEALANRIDPWTAFDAFGVSSVSYVDPNKKFPLGLFQSRQMMEIPL